MIPLKLTTIGSSTGVVLPKAALEKLRVKRGDTIYLTEIADGFLLTPYNKEVAEQLGAAEKIMREDRDVLKALAK